MCLCLQQVTDLPIVRDLVHSVSYSDFQQILGQKLGPNPGWHQVALMFRLTQTAVQLAGQCPAGSSWTYIFQ